MHSELGLARSSDAASQHDLQERLRTSVIAAVAADADGNGYELGRAAASRRRRSSVTMMNEARAKARAAYISLPKGINAGPHPDQRIPQLAGSPVVLRTAQRRLSLGSVPLPPMPPLSTVLPSATMTTARGSPANPNHASSGRALSLEALAAAPVVRDDDEARGEGGWSQAARVPFRPPPAESANRAGAHVTHKLPHGDSNHRTTLVDSEDWDGKLSEDREAEHKDRSLPTNASLRLGFAAPLERVSSYLHSFREAVRHRSDLEESRTRQQHEAAERVRREHLVHQFAAFERHILTTGSAQQQQQQRRKPKASTTTSVMRGRRRNSLVASPSDLITRARDAVIAFGETSPLDSSGLASHRLLPASAAGSATGSHRSSLQKRRLSLPDDRGLLTASLQSSQEQTIRAAAKRPTEQVATTAEDDQMAGGTLMNRCHARDQSTYIQTVCMYRLQFHRCQAPSYTILIWRCWATQLRSSACRRGRLCGCCIC